MEQTSKVNLMPGLIGSIAIVALMLIISACAWVKIPAGQQVPIHWGISGEPDLFTNKNMGLFLFPLVAIIEAGLMALIALIEPRRWNIKRSMKAYTVFWIASLGLLLVVHIFVVLSALGQKMDIRVVIPVAIGLLNIVVGNYMGKTRSNFFAGVRTPWTLSSELSWNKSNRLGGKLLIMFGVIMILMAFARNAFLWVVLMISEVILITIILAFYSYLVWKADPARGGTASEPKWMASTSMILMVILAAAAFMSQGAKPSADITTSAQEVVQSMASGDFTSAEKDFDFTMKAVLSTKRLGQIWSQLEVQYGPFKSRIGSREAQEAGFRTVHVICRFEKATMDIKVVFDKNGKIGGLWINPAQ